MEEGRGGAGAGAGAGAPGKVAKILPGWNQNMNMNMDKKNSEADVRKEGGAPAVTNVDRGEEAAMEFAAHLVRQGGKGGE